MAQLNSKTALAALLASTALVMAAPVQAQTVAPAAVQNGQARSFAISQGGLGGALSAFGAQAGMQVSIDPAMVRGVSSQGAVGPMTSDQALTRLFADTGLLYRVSNNTVFLDVADAQAGGPTSVSPVQVQGAITAPGSSPYADPAAPYKVDRLASSKFPEPVLNTPRTVTVLTKDTLEDQNATSLKDIGRSTAGVTLGSGEGGNAFGDIFFIRGFNARNDIFLDGVRDAGVSVRENFNTEQVEILRGPASSFAGRGTSGGAINIVSKQAQDKDFFRFEGDAGFSATEKRGTFDVNKAVSDQLDLRLNGMIQDAKVAGREFATDNRNGLAAAVTYKPLVNVTVKAGFSHTYMYGLPDFGVPYNPLTRHPLTEDGLSRKTYYGIVNRDFTKTTQDLGTLDAEWRYNDHVTFENKFRAGHSLQDYIGTAAENPSATNAVTAPFSSNPTKFSGYVQLNAQSRYQPGDVVVNQTEAHLKFDTGSVHNAAVVGAEISREKASLDSYAGFTSELTTGPVAFTSTGAPIVSAYKPYNYIFGAKQSVLTGNPLRYKIDTNSAYVVDTANWNEVVIVNGGLRFDDYTVSAANNTSSRTAHSGLTSYNFGAVYKPAPNGSIYFAYATAAQPVGSEFDGTSSTYGGFSPTQNTTQIFGPQTSEAIELGTKWELFNRHLLATASAFQTTVSNVRETAPANLPGYTSGQIVSGGQYQVRGIDIEFSGKITDKWSVLAGLVTMDPKVKKSVVPTNVGLQLANVAPTSFSLLTKYKITKRFELGGQAVYASQIKGGSLLAANGNVAYPNAPYPTLLPEHWRFDVFAEAKLNDHAELRLYVQNLLDKTYYDALYQSAQPFVLIAPGRAITLAAIVKF